ncbi:MAG: glycosyltransferase family 39 protein, partial [bacterium]|nr:glycosyltransferase family 39 protein [bacterium]
TIGADVHHDGIMFKPALDVSQGLMLFRDTFTQYGALTTIIQAIAIKIFGEYLLVIRYTTAFFYALTSVLLYFIWQKILNRALTFLSCIIWIFLAPYFVMTFLPWSSIYALFFQCLTLYFYIYYLDQNKTKYLIFTGIGAGLTFWCKQNVGAYVLAAFIVSNIVFHYINKNSFKKTIQVIIKFVYGTIIISIPIFIWLIINSALVDWWKQSIQYALFFIGSKSSISFINSLFPASISPVSIWSIMPIISLLALLYEINQKKHNKNVIAISIFSLFSWLQYYPVTCLRHVYWASTPMIGLVIYQLYKMSESFFLRNVIIRYIFLLLLTYLIFNIDITYRINGGIANYNQNYVNLEYPTVLKGVKLAKTEADFYQKTYNEIIDYKSKYGETYLITTGPNALYATFAKSQNFHKMYINWGIQLYPEYYLVKDQFIFNNQPLIYAIWEQTPGGYCKFDDTINPIDTSYLVAPCNKINPKFKN